VGRLPHRCHVCRRRRAVVVSQRHRVDRQGARARGGRAIAQPTMKAADRAASPEPPSLSTHRWPRWPASTGYIGPTYASVRVASARLWLQRMCCSARFSPPRLFRSDERFAFRTTCIRILSGFDPRWGQRTGPTIWHRKSDSCSGSRPFLPPLATSCTQGISFLCLPSLLSTERRIGAR
jgi:hypothetical protein